MSFLFEIAPKIFLPVGLVGIADLGSVMKFFAYVPARHGGYHISDLIVNRP